MRISAVLGILLVGACAPQTRLPSPEEVDAALRADLRGDPEASPAFKPGFGGVPERIQIEPPRSAAHRPSAGSVSLNELRHKPPRQARQAAARGARFSQAGEHQRAAAEFEKAIARDPDWANAHNRLGVEYAQLGRFGEAEAGLRRSLALDSNAWTTHYDLAVLLWQRGNFPDAERSVRRALELSGTNAQAHLLLGLLLSRRAETQADALSHLRYAARSIPQARQLLMSLQQP